MKQRRLNWDYIKDMYENGYSATEVAKTMGTSSPVIHKILKKTGAMLRDAGTAIALRAERKGNLSANPVAARSRARTKMKRHLGRQLKRYEDVHHKDSTPTNNSLDNLQVLTCSKHTQLHKTGADGEVGVSYCKQTGKWKASVMIDGVSHWLGRFTSRELAVKAVADFRQRTGAIGQQRKREPHYETEGLS